MSDKSIAFYTGISFECCIMKMICFKTIVHKSKISTMLEINIVDTADIPPRGLEPLMPP